MLIVYNCYVYYQSFFDQQMHTLLTKNVIEMHGTTTTKSYVYCLQKYVNKKMHNFPQTKVRVIIL
jgi:hypothetical protein